MPQQFAAIDPGELHARLGRGHAARLAVLTPNRRLAQALQADFDRSQLASGRASWEAPDILPFASFMERCHAEAAFAADAQPLPALLQPHEEQILWEDAVRGSEARDRILSAPATAALAADAWRLAHDWRIAGALDGRDGNEDHQAFAAWRSVFERRTARENVVDEARLPALVERLAAEGRIALPSTLVLHAFELLTPRQADVLAAFARLGVEVLRSEPAPIASQVRRTTFESPRRELEHAARWARARLESGGALARIAVVVPDLGARRAQVERVFARVLPGCFNISLGRPLASTPLVDAALAVVELCGGPVAFDRASRLLRSPFLAGAEAEMGDRARLDAALRRLAPATLALPRLRSLVADAHGRRGTPACPRLCRTLDALLQVARESGRAAPHEWARRFTAMLDAAGFPGERTLDSAEYQALARWRETLASLAALGSVASAWSAAEARTRLHRIATESVFQPASGEAPVQVLGILESAGLRFDHLWVSGLTEDAWPLPARPHPFVAPALQRQAGIPQASAETSLELDRSLTQAWCAAATEVVFSSARADGDRELAPSPLVASIAACPATELGVPGFATLREALFAAGRAPGASRSRADSLGPPLGEAAVHGGTAILADQAACPFRAFAHFRLEARALERPEPGLGPAERGQLLHLLMARLWSRLRDQATLLATDAASLAALIDEAAAHAVARVRSDRPGRLEGRFAELERERLAGLAREWLEVERARPPFEVMLSEEKMTLSAGNLRLEGRVDRIDRLAQGGLAVIDYKSGPVSVSAWLGERPDEPQLPLYALAAGEDEVRAVAFARLKTGRMEFAGLSRDEGLLPGVATVERHRAARGFAATWAELNAEWRAQIDKLGEDFASGDARVAPKRALSTCQRCDLRTLCRVNERLGALAEGEAPQEDP